MDCVGGPFTRQMMRAVRPGGICYLFGGLDSTVFQVQSRRPWVFPCSHCCKPRAASWDLSCIRDAHPIPAGSILHP